MAALQTADNIPAAKTAAQVLTQPQSAKCNAATSRMDFDAVCRSLFKPEAQNTASWPLTVSFRPFWYLSHSIKVPNAVRFRLSATADTSSAPVSGSTASEATQSGLLYAA